MAQAIPQQAGEITPQQIQEGIIQMKKSLSQIEGECNTMRSDAQSNIFINMANVCGRLVQQVDQLKRAKQESDATLEKIYQAHPEIKIAMAKQKPKANAAVSEKATVKVTKKA